MPLSPQINHHRSFTPTGYLSFSYQLSKLPIMNFLMTLFVGLATLVWGGFASMPLTPEAHWANTSITTSTAFVGCGTANSSGSLTTASKTASAEPSIYTPANFTVPTNITVGPIHWYLYALQVFADTRQHIAQ